jgi:hypothetical protein
VVAAATLLYYGHRNLWATAKKVPDMAAAVHGIVVNGIPAAVDAANDMVDANQGALYNLGKVTQWWGETLKAYGVPTSFQQPTTYAQVVQLGAKVNHAMWIGGGAMAVAGATYFLPLTMLLWPVWKKANPVVTAAMGLGSAMTYTVAPESSKKAVQAVVSGAETAVEVVANNPECVGASTGGFAGGWLAKKDGVGRNGIVARVAGLGALGIALTPTVACAILRNAKAAAYAVAAHPKTTAAVVGAAAIAAGVAAIAAGVAAIRRFYAGVLQAAGRI